jgi:hypothetical protein
MIKRLNLTELGPGPEVFKKEMAPILCGKAPQTSGDLLRIQRGSDGTRTNMGGWNRAEISTLKKGPGTGTCSCSFYILIPVN